MPKSHPANGIAISPPQLSCKMGQYRPGLEWELSCRAAVVCGILAAQSHLQHGICRLPPQVPCKKRTNRACHAYQRYGSERSNNWNLFSEPEFRTLAKSEGRKKCSNYSSALNRTIGMHDTRALPRTHARHAPHVCNTCVTRVHPRHRTYAPHASHACMHRAHACLVRRLHRTQARHACPRHACTACTARTHRSDASPACRCTGAAERAGLTCARGARMLKR
jgi:hypothetical protein